VIDPDATVFLVDDEDSVRNAITRLLRSAGCRVQAFASARAFLDGDREVEAPACLVLDVQMPEMGGLDLQRELRIAHAGLPIIFLTGHGDIPMSVQAMKGGAVDFLTKPVQDTDLLRAIEQALDRAIHDRAERAERAVVRQRLDSLTPREREVMALVVAGRRNKEIAHELGTTEKTIKVHRARVMAKMGARSLAALVRMAGRIGFPQDA
jgi:RNA polymerase sigma factor (sigma-70 family)